ncbi:Ig-like domain-containing protein [Variovorax sp. UC122_21]|uniref:Ig-like domain-containing protein n=1 Tax=Variovorax sp. UC122_21 TaxID=3374554 RepID=UPI003756C302
MRASDSRWQDSGGAFDATPNTITFDIAAVNDAPVANPETIGAVEDTPLTIPVGTLLANDTDVDGNPLTITSVQDATNGTVSLVGGNVVFTPAANYNGPASFSYTVSDGQGGSSTVTVTVNVGAVNDAPVAGNDIATTPINTPLANIPVLANDTDVDGDPLTVTGASLNNPAQGTVTVNADGTLNFTPAANVTGPVVISYTVSDGKGGTDTATLTVNVGANTPPDSADATISGTEDTPVVLGTANFAFTDADAGQALANVRIDTLPANGTLLLDGVAVATGQVISAADIAAGRLSFVPAANGNGTGYASFSFSVQDSGGAFDTTPNRISFDIAPVNDAPVGTPDTVNAVEDTPLTIPASALLGNDSDADGDTLTITSVQGAVNGTVSLVGGNVVFTPNANYNGPASFTYTVSDGNGGSSTVTVTVNVAAANDAPMASPDTVAATEDTPLTIPSSVLLGNDTDVDGDALSIVSVQDATNGTVSLVGGNVIFTPAANYNGPASFTYTVSDGQGGTSTVTVTVNVGAVNDAPVAGNDIASTPINTPLANIPVLANDSDVDGDSLTVTSATLNNPAQGSVSINADGTLNFTPASNVTGAVVISYMISDGNGGTATATLTVNVGANTPPNSADATIAGTEDTPVVLGSTNFAFTDGDAGQTLANVRIDTLPANGTLLLDDVAVTAGQVISAADIAAGRLSFVPGADGNGTGYEALRSRCRTRPAPSTRRRTRSASTSRPPTTHQWRIPTR